MAVSAAGKRDIVQAGNYLGTNKYAVTYQSSEGVLALPLAEANLDSGLTMEIVRVHQPMRIRQVDFEASKTNTPPLIPAPQDNAKEYLISSELTFPLPSVNADRSTSNWQAFGSLRFAEREPWTVASGYRIGDYPMSNTPAVLQAAGLLGGGGVIVALSLQDGETIANDLGEFDSAEYATKAYNYNYHFPSRYLSADMSIGS